jgi:serine/threonine protein kinase
MTTRDPSRPRIRPDSGREPREPTQSLEVDPSEHPSLAVGTSGPREERTKLESPAARHKTPVPVEARPSSRRHHGTVDDPNSRLGEILGVYRLDELLGKGGMGYVYRAEHVKLGREVALKLLRSDYARRRDAVLRFFQEAKTVNRVRHRNIVDVTDFVELDDGTTFIIMEFLRGQSLGRWARSGAVDLPRALAVLVQICDGLGAAHAVGVIHRDLKPDNVIVVPTSDGAELVKLLDFGVAKLLNRDDEDLGFQTAAGSVIGTPAYMSPEQAGGMAIDHRSDIYSLGAIMYELFCGQPMFRGRSFGEYVRKHLTEMPVLPHQTQGGANIDHRLEALILRCLEKDPNARFGHILELRDGLLHMLGGIDTHPPQYQQIAQSAARPLPTTQLPPHMLPLPPPMITTMPTPQSDAAVSAHLYSYAQQPTPLPPVAATPWWVWVAGGTFAIGLGIAGAVWYATREQPPPPPAAPHVMPAEAPAPAPAAAPKIVELRFDSLPKAGVYVEGHSAELCRTPCSFDINLADGGPTDHRTFVVRSEGYRDKPIVVDLASDKRDYSVTLDQLETATPPVATQDDPAEKVVHRPLLHPGKKVTRQVEKKQPPAEKPPEKPTETAEKPPEKPPEKKKPAGGIDPTDTVDPFHHP